MHRARLVEQRLHDPPSLLDRVLAGKELVVAGDRIAEQPLVWLGLFAWDLFEENLHVGRLERLLARFLGKEAHAGTRRRLDSHRHLVRFGSLAGANAERRWALEDHRDLAR